MKFPVIDGTHTGALEKRIQARPPFTKIGSIYGMEIYKPNDWAAESLRLLQRNLADPRLFGVFKP